MKSEDTPLMEEPNREAHTPDIQKTGYFVTNQLNLLYMLAAGMIMPPKAFGEKYYEDSLSLAPGWIPLFSKSVPSKVLSNVVKESRTLVAVIVGVNLSSIKGGARSVNLNGRIKDIHLPEDLTSQQPCILLPAPIPTSFIECIYFETKEEKKAFDQDANDYANVPVQIFKRAIRKKLFARAGNWYWPEKEDFSSHLNVAMDNYQAAGGIMAMLLNCGNLGEFSMLACRAAFDGISDTEKFKVEGTILEGMPHWMQHGEKPDSKDVLNELYWGIVDQIVQHNLSQKPPLPLKDTLLKYLEAFKEKTETQYKKALSGLVTDLRGVDQFGAKNATELLDSHKGEVRRALILFFLFKKCSELLAFSHPAMKEKDTIAAALLFAVREKWLGLPLEPRDFAGLDQAVSHRMASIAYRLLKTGIDLGPPPPRCRPIRELLIPGADDWSKKQKEAALYLAREMKWPCITTKIRIGKGDYELNIDAGGITIHFPGEVKAVDTEIQKQEFFEKLGQEGFLSKKVENRARRFINRGES